MNERMNELQTLLSDFPFAAVFTDTSPGLLLLTTNASRLLLVVTVDAVGGFASLFILGHSATK